MQLIKFIQCNIIFNFCLINKLTVTGFSQGDLIQSEKGSEKSELKEHYTK